MQLITNPECPFGARITIAARAKGIEIEYVRAAREWVRSTAFFALNPVGKIPVLITDSGEAIPESEAVVNYLEDRYPQPALRPADPDDRARMNVVIRMTETYIMGPVGRLFAQLDPSRRDERVVELEVGRWQEGLGALEHYLRSPLPNAEAGLSVADCILAPSLHLSVRIAKKIGMASDLLHSHPPLLQYYSRIKEHPIVGRVLDDLLAAQAVYDTKPSASSP